MRSEAGWLFGDLTKIPMSSCRDELQTTAKLMHAAAVNGAAKQQAAGTAATEVPGPEPSIPHWLWEQAQVQQIPNRLLELQCEEVSNIVLRCLPSPEHCVMCAPSMVAKGTPWVLQWLSVRQPH